MGGTQSTQEVGIWYNRLQDLENKQKKLVDRQTFLAETLIRVLEDNVNNKNRLKVIKGTQRKLWS